MFRDIDRGLNHEFREGDSVYQRAPEVRAIPNIGEESQMYGVGKRRLDVPLSHGPVEDDRQNSNNSKDDSSGPD